MRQPESDKALLKSLCALCENDVQVCKYSYLIRKQKICPYFNPKYNCSACQHNCGDDTLCYRFDSKAATNQLEPKAHPVEDTMKRILLDLMQLEKSTEDAIIKFKQALEANGVKAALVDVRLMGYINNLIALHTLDKLIIGYGLKDFRKCILEKEIDRIFNPDRKIQKRKPQV